MLTPVPHTGLNDSYNDAIRAEDIRFSPSGRILAVVATNSGLYLFAVDTATRPIQITKSAVFFSGSLASPHGVDFISEDILAVANRGAWVTFYRIPPVSEWTERSKIEPFHEMNAPWFGAKGEMRSQGERKVLCGIGSVRVKDNRIFVCCNKQSTLSVHPFKLWWRWLRIGKGKIITSEGLAIPDGISISRDGKWTAIGEHENRWVVIFRSGDFQARCKLTDPGLDHPHGICFDPTGRALYVADAGQKDIHVFVTGDDWASSMEQSTFKLPAVEEAAFKKTKESVGVKYAPLEGGIKGMDLNADGTLLATTCQNQMLRFFDVKPLTV